MTWIAAIALAAICNSVMDSVAHHFPNSVFKQRKAIFWDPSISWKNKYNDGDPSKGHKTIKIKIPTLIWKKKKDG
jgi:hypothetical protein